MINFRRHEGKWQNILYFWVFVTFFCRNLLLLWQDFINSSPMYVWRCFECISIAPEEELQIMQFNYGQVRVAAEC